MSKTFGHKQRGMTALGFIMSIAVVGVLLFAVLKVTPIYLENRRVQAVLADIKEEMDGKGATANQIRMSMARRLDIEMIKLPREVMKIRKSRNGYTIEVKYDNRTHYFGDLWLMVVLDERIEIIR
jgi:hypothetical protein